MKKRKISFDQIRTLIIIPLTILISCCNGQENRTNHQNIEVLHPVLIHDLTPDSKKPKEQISQVVRMMFQDSKGNIWFGTQGGAFKYADNILTSVDGIKSESGKRVTVKDIKEGKDGKIWIGHTDGISCVTAKEVTNYYESDGLISNDVWNIEIDAEGTVWIGTIEGVCKFDGEKFTNFELPEGEVDTTLGISSKKMVHCIMEDSKENIWFCTNAGLFKFTDNILTNVSEKVGLQTNFVNEIIEDRNGRLWISTKEGLYKMDGNHITNITSNIPDIGKGIGCLVEDNDGIIWFVLNQHYLYTYDSQKIIQFKKPENNKGPVVFQIFEDQKERLWFVGYGGAYRLESGKFINITKEGPW